jgi:hypothetical protein
MSSKEMTEKTNEMALVQERPAFLDPNSRRGSEDVAQDDITLPRIEVLQALSPQLKRNDAQFIPGAEMGMIFNTVSGKLYGNEVVFVPILFRKEWIVWASRDAGGGFMGSFGTEEEAEEFRQTLDNPDDHETNLHAVNFVYILDGENVEEAVFSWSRSKLKISRRLNALVQMSGTDRFASAYRLKAVEEKGKKGEYYTYDVKGVGYVPEPIYRRAEALYKAIKAGERKVAYGNQADEVDEESAVI